MPRGVRPGMPVEEDDCRAAASMTHPQGDVISDRDGLQSKAVEEHANSIYRTIGAQDCGTTAPVTCQGTILSIICPVAGSCGRSTSPPHVGCRDDTHDAGQRDASPTVRSVPAGTSPARSGTVKSVPAGTSAPASTLDQTRVRGSRGPGGSVTPIASPGRTVPLRTTMPMTPARRCRTPSSSLRSTCRSSPGWKSLIC